MDASKLRALLLHVAAEDGIDAQRMEKVCRMYMDAEEDKVVDGLTEACEKALGGKTVKPLDVMDLLKDSAGEDLKTILDAVQFEDAPAVSSSTSALLGADLEDDDDDEEVEEVKKIQDLPVLRGLVKLKEAKIVWSGSWAMSKEKFDAGERSKFKYSYAGDKTDLTASAPPAGKYNGHFMVKSSEEGAAPQKISEKGIDLQFGKLDEKGFIAVTGSGSNVFGEFTLSGMFHPDSARMSLVKTYKVSDSAFVDNEDEEDEEDWDLIDDSPEDTAAELADLKADAEEDIDAIRKRLRIVEETAKGVGSKRKK